MNDRELLEYAAKSFFSNGPIHISNSGFMDWVYDTHGAWNPLTDDGDALRLAVKLSLFINSNFNHNVSKEIEKMIGNNKITNDVDVNWLIATRRAIVRAAAEIGKQK